MGEEKITARTKTSRFDAIQTVGVIGFVVIALIVWHAATIFLIGFASILLAILLTRASASLARLLHLPYQLSLTLLLTALAAFLLLFFWLSMPLITSQLVQLLEQVPQAYAEFKADLATREHWKSLSKMSFTDHFILNNGNLFKHLGQIFSFTASSIVHFILFFLVGIYLAYSPRRYVDGFVALMPQRHRARTQQVLAHLTTNLRWWIMGKCIAMATIGFLTIIGLWLLHIPLAFILGLLMALFTFIPYVGAILASIPAILIAISIDPWQGLWVTLLYIGIHALEGYCITPYIEQRTVSLPPAVTVMTQVLLAFLIGFLGLALASPLIVVAMVLMHEFILPKSTTMRMKTKSERAGA